MRSMCCSLTSDIEHSSHGIAIICPLKELDVVRHPRSSDQGLSEILAVSVHWGRVPLKGVRAPSKVFGGDIRPVYS